MKVGARHKPKAHTHRPKSDPYYQTRDWQNLVLQVWLRDEFQCKECERQGLLKPLTKPSANINYQGHVDHIIPRPIGKDELSNLELLCYSCHATKSSHERRPPLSGHTLIHVVGNIASGKTTLCKQLSDRLSIPYYEINAITKPNTNQRVILESSGLGWKVNHITKQFVRVITILCECSHNSTMQRLQQREANGYQYPINRLTPLQYYHRIKPDMDSIEPDQRIDTDAPYDITAIIKAL